MLFQFKQGLTNLFDGSDLPDLKSYEMGSGLNPQWQSGPEHREQRGKTDWSKLYHYVTMLFYVV